MKTLILAPIRCSLMFLVTGSLFSVQPAQAYTVTLQQTGSNVVATGSGAINLTALTFVISGADNPGIVPFSGVISTGPFASMIDGYRGFTGPMDFGSGAGALPNTASGDFVGISGGIMFPFLLVPQGYASGAALSDSMTFNNATFASLDVTPGTYVWTWGTGANQNFTLQIGAVPDGGSIVSLLGLASLGLVALQPKSSRY